MANMRRFTNQQPFDDSRDPRSGGTLPGRMGPPPAGPPVQAPEPEYAGPQGGIPDEILPGRGGEGPRERQGGGGQAGPPTLAPGGSAATPTQPMAPTPEAGSPGPIVGSPIPQVPPISLTSTLRNQGGAFGSQGGLTGGGFGLPFDPTSNQQSDPISSLLQLLKQGGGGGGGAY